EVSADGRHALAVSADGTLRWWDLEAGRCLHTLDRPAAEVQAMALSADNRRALAGSADGAPHWWGAEDGRCVRTLKVDTDGVRKVALSGYRGRQGFEWLADGTLHQFNDEVCKVALSADGRRGLAWSADGTLRCWDLEDGRCLRVMEE